MWVTGVQTCALPIFPEDLTIESGELTPSMKVKRNVVEANNSEQIDAFYA